MVGNFTFPAFETPGLDLELLSQERTEVDKLVDKLLGLDRQPWFLPQQLEIALLDMGAAGSAQSQDIVESAGSMAARFCLATSRAMSFSPIILAGRPQQVWPRG